MTEDKIKNIIEDAKKIEEEEDIVTELFGCACHALYHTSELSYHPPYKEEPDAMYFNLMIEQYRDGFWPYSPCGYNFFSKKFWKDFYRSSVYKRFVISFKYLFSKKYNNEEPLLSSLDFKAEDLGRLYQTLDLYKTEVKEEIDASQLELELESYTYKLKFRIEDFFRDDYFPPTLGTCIQFKKENGFKKLWTALKYAFGSGDSNFGRTDEFEIKPKDAAILKNIIKKIKKIALERVEKRIEEGSISFIKEKKIYTELLNPDLQPTLLSEKDFKRFLEILKSNEEPCEALKKAVEKYKKNK